MNDFSHTKFMLKALKEAQKAADEQEVPIGAVITYQNEVISQGRNRREKLNNALLHAEIEAIYKACHKLKRWRLTGCNLYVTLEPCPMCAGAIINSRISNLIYGANDPKAGSCGSIVNLFEMSFNHSPQIVSGILKDQCSEVLSSFFKDLRKTKKLKK